MFLNTNELVVFNSDNNSRWRVITVDASQENQIPTSNGWLIDLSGDLSSPVRPQSHVIISTHTKELTQPVFFLRFLAQIFSEPVLFMRYLVITLWLKII